MILCLVMIINNMVYITSVMQAAWGVKMINSTHSLILICAFLLSACQQESSQPSSSCEPIPVDMYIVELTDLNPSAEPLDQEISNMYPELLCEECLSLHRMWQEMSV